jgi:hypothetical protein
MVDLTRLVGSATKLGKVAAWRGERHGSCVANNRSEHFVHQ